MTLPRTETSLEAFYDLILGFFRVSALSDDRLHKVFLSVILFFYCLSYFRYFCPLFYN